MNTTNKFSMDPTGVLAMSPQARPQRSGNSNGSNRLHGSPPWPFSGIYYLYHHYVFIIIFLFLFFRPNPAWLISLLVCRGHLLSSFRGGKYVALCTSERSEKAWRSLYITPIVCMHYWIDIYVFATHSQISLFFFTLFSYNLRHVFLYNIFN